MLKPPPAELLISSENTISPVRFDRDPALRRVRAGAYVPTDAWDALKPWERYLLRVHAVARSWRNPTFCLEAALSLQGLPIFGEPAEIHVLDTYGRRRGDVHMHGGIRNHEIATIDGLSLTTWVDTAVAFARVAPPAHALAVADAVIRSHLDAGRDVDLRQRAAAQAERRGLRQVAWVQEHARAEAESVGEAVSRAVIEWLGYEEPELQVEFVAEGHRDRVDFFWRAAQVIGESDGYGKYDASDPRAMKAHFVREKQREDRLRRQVRGFARWDWKDAMHPDRLDRTLRNAGLRPVRPRRQRMLDAVAQNPRGLPAATGIQHEKPDFG
ncbi:MAG TPA: hypothetical protein VJR25_09500 [Microbacterium sp.]|uniref:hypothetical protein n=1 Tax=Microbacterium sp. TaxID=51671 RepID=UPI002B4A0210|nr:hypothetical protein [Microbacterium sp.]HKT56996.1 hypothetical protein [Microbacterium sp.]